MNHKTSKWLRKEGQRKVSQIEDNRNRLQRIGCDRQRKNSRVNPISTPYSLIRETGRRRFNE